MTDFLGIAVPTGGTGFLNLGKIVTEINRKVETVWGPDYDILLIPTRISTSIAIPFNENLA